MIKAVLFDLDGTLADTAPDLAGALNILLREQGAPLIEFEKARPLTSIGARGMIKAGLGIEPLHPEFETLRDRYLQIYRDNICIDTRLFDGVPELLTALEAQKIAWGIVTNKHERFTAPLLKALQLDIRAACVVCGDTTAHAKPHPDPLLHAAKLIGVAPRDCLYVGDDVRDIQAARAAGMPVIA
ncbi:MAG TPA: HAD-IA family hydrolase, partial [Burkholderiales bacterium]|nr:HAD-IA family hydrolase [Burkholderiales bacterium]